MSEPSLPRTMRAWRLHRLRPGGMGEAPLSLDEVDVPEPGPEDLLLRVRACGVCHTELDESEGRAAPPSLPVIPGHQVVGDVVSAGEGVMAWLGRRVGVAWIHGACGNCEACQAGQENLCPAFRGCGRDTDGGYAEYHRVPAAFAHELPSTLSDRACAPLLTILPLDCSVISASEATASVRALSLTRCSATPAARPTSRRPDGKAGGACREIPQRRRLLAGAGGVHGRVFRSEQFRQGVQALDRTESGRIPEDRVSQRSRR